MVQNKAEPTGRAHHVSQVVHAQLVRVHAQRCLLVVGVDHVHVLLPDGPADLLFTLRHTHVLTSDGPNQLIWAA